MEIFILEILVIYTKILVRSISNHNFQYEFQRLFPKHDLNDYFESGTYAFGLSKSLGTITPIDVDGQNPLHRNWATSPCERFHVSKLKVNEYFKLLRKY